MFLVFRDEASNNLVPLAFRILYFIIYKYIKVHRECLFSFITVLFSFINLGTCNQRSLLSSRKQLSLRLVRSTEIEQLD